MVVVVVIIIIILEKQLFQNIALVIDIWFMNKFRVNQILNIVYI